MKNTSREEDKSKASGESRFFCAIKAAQAARCGLEVSSEEGEEDCVTVERRKGNTRDPCSAVKGGGHVNGTYCSDNATANAPLERRLAGNSSVC